MAAVGEPIVLTQGDTLIGVQSILCEETLVNGVKTITPIDLTGSAVHFRMVNKATEEAVVEAGVATIGLNGAVSYDWAAGETDQFGQFKAYWIRTKNGKVQHFPAGEDWIPVVIAKKR